MLLCSSSEKKKRVKPLILLVLDPNWAKQGVRMGHKIKMKINVFFLK